jgi:hypothetical protein
VLPEVAQPVYKIGFILECSDAFDGLVALQKYNEPGNP